MAVVQCESCGMTMKSIEDYGGGIQDNKYCVKCTDESGVLYPFEKKLEMMTMFIMSRQGVNQMMAKNMAQNIMKDMPAWKGYFIS